VKKILEHHRSGVDSLRSGWVSDVFKVVKKDTWSIWLAWGSFCFLAKSSMLHLQADHLSFPSAAVSSGNVAFYRCNNWMVVFVAKIQKKSENRLGLSSR